MASRACAVSRSAVARLMATCGAVGIHYKRRGGCTRPGDGDTSDDLIDRAFDSERDPVAPRPTASRGRSPIPAPAAGY